MLKCLFFLFFATASLEHVASFDPGIEDERGEEESVQEMVLSEEDGMSPSPRTRPQVVPLPMKTSLH